MKKALLLLSIFFLALTKSHSQTLYFDTVIVNKGVNPPTVYFRIKKVFEFNFDRITITPLNDSNNTQVINVYFQFDSCVVSSLLINRFDSTYSFNATFPFSLKVYSILDTTIHCPAHPIAPMYRDSFFLTANQIITLPIFFTHINAQTNNKSTLIKWGVGEESNVKSYVVERSDKSQKFNTIAEISPKQIREYSWIDEQPLSGGNYYRIKAINKDGSYKYSPVVNTKMVSGGLTVYPNPIKNNELHLNWNNIRSEKITVQLYSSDGKLVFTKNISANSISTTVIELPNSIKRGIYFLKATSSEQMKLLQQLVFVD